MSRLRILEEERKRPKRMPFEEREKLLNVIKHVLESREEIELVVVHGGFIESEVFRDIDMAIYTSHRIGIDKAPEYVFMLKDMLEKTTGLCVDIHLLDYAPPGIVYNVLQHGRILIEKHVGTSSILRIHALEDLRRLNKNQEKTIQPPSK